MVRGLFIKDTEKTLTVKVPESSNFKIHPQNQERSLQRLHKQLSCELRILHKILFDHLHRSFALCNTECVTTPNISSSNLSWASRSASLTEDSTPMLLNPVLLYFPVLICSANNFRLILRVENRKIKEKWGQSTMI